MKRRAAATLAVLALVVAGCHSKVKPTPPAGKPTATLLVTRDFGAGILLAKRVAPGQTVMTALRAVAPVDTRYGGRFVQSIEGISGSLTHAKDWTYFVNGLEARVGATDVTLHAGDRVWWDFHAWADLPTVPAVVGSFPEPFVHGTGRRAGQVEVRGSDALLAALRSGRRTRGPRASRWRVLVGSDASLRSGSGLPRGRPARRSPRALTVSVRDGHVVGYAGRARSRRSRRARAAIFAIRASGGATLFVAGRRRVRRPRGRRRELAAHPAIVAPPLRGRARREAATSSRRCAGEARRPARARRRADRRRALDTAARGAGRAGGRRRDCWCCARRGRGSRRSSRAFGIAALVRADQPVRGGRGRHGDLLGPHVPGGLLDLEVTRRGDRLRRALGPASRHRDPRLRVPRPACRSGPADRAREPRRPSLGPARRARGAPRADDAPRRRCALGRRARAGPVLRAGLATGTRRCGLDARRPAARERARARASRRPRR